MRDSRLFNWYFFRFEDGANNKSICQYMRLDYLIQLLETEKYYVKRRRIFVDANESYKNIKLAFTPKAVGTNEITSLSESKRLIPYTSLIDCPTACWSKNNKESFLMWKTYATEVGVCIKSNIHDFIASIKINLGIENNDNKIICGSMDYKDIMPSTIEEKQLFDKDMAYVDENEFRFYFLLASDCNKEDKGVYIPIDSRVMIEEVLLSPFICKDASDKIARMIKDSYGINVKQSNIKLKL